MAGPTHIQVHHGDPTRITFVGGRFDGIAIRELFEAAMALPDHPRLLVDCEGVEMISSGAMGMLVTIHKRFVSHGGQLHVAVPDRRVRHALEIANLHRLLRVFDDSVGAAAAFDR